MQINVSHNLGSAMDKWLGGIQKGLEKAVASSLNTVVNEAKARMATEISAEYKITRAEAMAGLRVDLARTTTGKSFMTARLYAPSRKKGRGFNLIRFVEKKVTFAEAKRRRKAGTLEQVRVQIKRSGGLKTLPNAFIANKGRTVFVRVGKARLPIKALTTVDIPQMFNTKSVNAKVVAMIRARLPYVLAEKVRAAKG